MFSLAYVFHRKDNVLQGFSSPPYTLTLQVIKSLQHKPNLGRTECYRWQEMKGSIKQPPPTAVSCFTVQLLSQISRFRGHGLNPPMCRSQRERAKMTNKKSSGKFILFPTLLGVHRWERGSFHSSVGIASQVAFMKYSKTLSDICRENLIIPSAPEIWPLLFTLTITFQVQVCMTLLLGFGNHFLSNVPISKPASLPSF